MSDEIEVLTTERDNALLKAEQMERELRRKIEDCGCDGQAYEDIRAERDDALADLHQTELALVDVRGELGRLRDHMRTQARVVVEYAAARDTARDAVAAMTVEIADLRAALDLKSLVAAALREQIAEMLASFTEAGHPGAPCHRTGWVRDDHLTQWHKLYRETS